MPEPVSARPVPRMRPKGSANSGAMTPRQRPQTIHVDKNADVNDALRPSRGNRGSSSNISGIIGFFSNIPNLSVDFEL